MFSFLRKRRNTVTVRLDFVGHMKKRLQLLQEQSGSRNLETTILKAVAIYETIIREVSVGSDVFIRDVLGHARPLTVR